MNYISGCVERVAYWLFSATNREIYFGVHPKNETG